MLYGHLESQKWYAEEDEATICRKREIKGIFRFEVEKNGKETWHPILISRTHTFEAGKVYKFSIQAKANKPAKVYVAAIRDEKNYGNLGFSAAMNLTTEWQTFSFVFVPKATSQNARFDIGGFKEGFTYDFHAASLKPVLGAFPGTFRRFVHGSILSWKFFGINLGEFRQNRENLSIKAIVMPI